MTTIGDVRNIVKDYADGTVLDELMSLREEIKNLHPNVDGVTEHRNFLSAGHYRACEKIIEIIDAKIAAVKGRLPVR